MGRREGSKTTLRSGMKLKVTQTQIVLCTERRERFSIRTFLYRPATIVITLITRTPQPHHKTGYHSESLLIKSKHSLGFNFNFLECTLDGAVILWLEKHIWNHFFHCAEHAGAQMVQVRPNVFNIKSGSAIKNKSSRLERKNWFPKFKGR